MSQDGSRIIAGAMGAPGAYVFRRDGDSWVQEAKLSTDGGASVAINFPYCAVGLPNYQFKGAMDLFSFDGVSWNLVKRFVPSDGTIEDSYGIAVAIDEQTLAAGSPLHKNESGPGVVYVYDPHCTGTED